MTLAILLHPAGPALLSIVRDHGGQLGSEAAVSIFAGHLAADIAPAAQHRGCSAIGKEPIQLRHSAEAAHCERAS